MLREEPRINYPWEAIRELAMNAVMHRAYNGNNSPIKFYEYSDRIEIDNPGNLYGKVNLENFPNRNRLSQSQHSRDNAQSWLCQPFRQRCEYRFNTSRRNKSNPAEFLLGDYTTFKVVVKNADVIENGTNVIEKRLMSP